MDEEKIIEKISKLFHVDQGIVTGIGDDAAVLDLGMRDNMLFLAAADQVLSRVHFTEDTPLIPAAEKLFKRNLSDIAAMGGLPTYALVTVAMNPFNEERLVEFHKGLANVSSMYGTPVIGGDLAASPAPGLTASLTIFGKVEKNRLCLRTNAADGDFIYCTGWFGNSFLSGKHLSFTPRLHEARFVSGTYTVAMMDVSDGLAKDIGRMAEASGLSAKLEPDAVPLAPGATVRQALSEGEDYELVFAVPPEKADDLEKSWPFPGVKLTRIGTFIKGETGKVIGIPDDANTGYDHFHDRKDN